MRTSRSAKAFYRFDTLSCLNITLNQTSLSAAGIDESVAGQAIAARHEAWVARMPNEGGALWAFVASLPIDELMSLVAHCASLSLNAVQRPGDNSRRGAIERPATLAKVMPHQMSRYWQPTVGNYLGRVSKERILEAVREGLDDDASRRIVILKNRQWPNAPSNCWPEEAGYRPCSNPLRALPGLRPDREGESPLAALPFAPPSALRCCTT